MSYLKSSHSVSLPLPKDLLTPPHKKQTSRRNRKTVFSLRGDESPAVELPPLPRWMINTPINSKFPMIPAPKGKIVLFTTDLCQTRHPAPSALEFDPSAQGVSSTYQSLHDPHLKNHYWQAESFDRLVRGGFVTPDGKVKCTLKEFNDFQQYLKRVRLEKMDQDHKRLLEIERDEKEKRRYDRVKTVDQLAHEKRIEDAQKKCRQKNKERQKRLKQQLDAYDAKHACIITDHCLRREIDEVKRELEEQRRLNHKLQVEKEEHEKKITFLRKRAKEERQRAKRLEERVITKKEDQEKLLEEKWDRKLLSKDSGFASEYLLKLRSNSKLTDSVTSRKRKLELGWLKQQADSARISEARMKRAAEEETKITANLERKLTVIRKKFERKLKKLQAMLRSGGIPPVVQLQRTHQFAVRKIEWERDQEEKKLQREREREMQKEMKRRQRQLERERREKEREARAAITTCMEILKDESLSLVPSHPSWGEAMSEVGLCADILPPIKITSGEEEEDGAREVEKPEEDRKESSKRVQFEEPEDRDYDEQEQSRMAQELVSQSVEKAVAKNIVQETVEKAVAQNVAVSSLEEVLASQVILEVIAKNTSLLPHHVESEPPEIPEEIEPTPVMHAESETDKVAKLQDTPSVATARKLAVDAIGEAHDELETDEHTLGDTPSVFTAKQLASDAIGDACDEMVKPAKPLRLPVRKTPSNVARAIAESALDDVIGDMTSEGSGVEGGLMRQTSSHIGRGLAYEAVEDAVYEVTQEDYDLRQTPSNIGQKLADGVLVDAVDELDQIADARLCVVFRDIPEKIKTKQIDAIQKHEVDVAKEEHPEEIKEETSEEIQKTSEIEIPIVQELSREIPKETPSVITAKHLAKLSVGGALSELQDIADNYLKIDRVVCRQTSRETAVEDAAVDIKDIEGIEIETSGRKTPSNLGRQLVESAVEQATEESVRTSRTDARQTPSNIARDLAGSAIQEAAFDIEHMEGIPVETDTRQTPSNLARQLTNCMISLAKDDIHRSSMHKTEKISKSRSEERDSVSQPVTRLTQSASDDRVADSRTPSDIARDITGNALHEAAFELETFEGADVETDARHTPSNLARKLAKGAIVRAKDDIHESSKLYEARKKSFYKTKSLDADTKVQPMTATRKTRSDVYRFLANGAFEGAATNLEEDDHVVDVTGRTTPSKMARGLAESTIKDEDEVMRVIYRKTPSNLARVLAEDVMVHAADDFEKDGECVVVSLRKTPSNIARSLAKVAVVDAVGEINNQAERTDVPLRSFPSNVARSLVQSAVDEAGNELDKQSPIYVLPIGRRKTPSDIARSVTSEVMSEAIGELEYGGRAVDGKCRRTPSNVAREITGNVITDAESEIETGSPDLKVYQIRGKTSSNIARIIAADAISDSVDEIEGEGKSVEGILRKTPSNLGRFLAQDVVGEALGELDKAKLSSGFSGIHTGVSGTSMKAEDFEFNEEDLTEIWGDSSNVSSILNHSSALLTSVMDVFSDPIVSAAVDDEEDEEEENEEVVGILENPLIAENEPILLNLDPSLTEIIHYTEDNKAVVEGAVKISSGDGLLTKPSFTEATLSLESLSKNKSGQLIREKSSSSSAGEPPASPPDAPDVMKGPQYFKLIPFYNNKSIDIGDEIVKSNLSAISIKPDLKKGLAAAHHPQSRNSFRNIFRPDMTHCEGSARCLKDTLVTQIRKDAGEEQKTAFDECCKVLEEKQVDITARHSDEELVAIGDVEGVCMRPKAQQKAYRAHVINSPVIEKTAEQTDDDITNNTAETIQTNDNQNKESNTDKEVVTEKSSSLLNILIVKISSVFKRRSSDKQSDEKEPSQMDQNGQMDETSQTDKSIASTANVTDQENYCADKIVCVEDSSRSVGTESSVQKATEGVREGTPSTSPKEADSQVEDGQTVPLSEQVITDASQKLTTDDTNDDEKQDKLTSIDSGIPDIEKTVQAISETKVGHKESTKVISKDELKPSRLGGKTSSKKSVEISRSTSSKKKKKSGVSIIYVKPAENRPSRSSCTVLVAGKSITSQPDDDKKSNERLKTPEDSRQRSVVLHKVKQQKGSDTRCSSAKTESNAHHRPSVAKAESEDARLRECVRQSQTTMRKFSHQTLPKSSHRMVSASYSASELEGNGSKIVGSSVISTETNKDAMWPISRLSSECSSEGAEGMRTPKELSSPPDTMTKTSPRACTEQLDLKQQDKNLTDKLVGEHQKQPATGTASESDHHNSIQPRSTEEEEQKDNLNNSADKEQQQQDDALHTPGTSSSHSSVHRPVESRQHSGVIGKILSRVFSIGKAKVNQVAPITGDEQK